MDSIEAVVLQSEISAAVVVDSEARIQLVDLAGSTAELASSLAARGMRFLGCVGIDGGNQVRCAFNCELTTGEREDIFAAFMDVVSRASARVQEELSAEWLERLYQLPDTREN